MGGVPNVDPLRDVPATFTHPRSGRQGETLACRASGVFCVPGPGKGRGVAAIGFGEEVRSPNTGPRARASQPAEAGWRPGSVTRRRVPVVRALIRDPAWPPSWPCLLPAFDADLTGTQNLVMIGQLLDLIPV
jgi:hypothetical protein